MGRMRPLRIFAVLFGLLALSNFLQPLGLSPESGFVFLGKRLSGTPNLIAAWSFAVFLACYATALWRETATALPLGLAYAAYLHVSLHYALLFTFRNAEPPFDSALVFGIYTIAALGSAWGAVVVMLRRGLAKREHAPARILLRAFALLFALMALSNALKPFAYASDVGFILFGQRLRGTANVVAALTFSALLATYAVSLWGEKRRALPLAIAYALYVFANLVLWNIRTPEVERGAAPVIFSLPYLVSAVGVSSGAALLLWRYRKRLV